jgi:hypothetical protein
MNPATAAAVNGPADTSVQSLVLWGVAFLTFINLGSLIWTIFSSPAKAAGRRIDDLNGRADQHDLRLAALEQSQRALPSAGDLHELELAMAELKGEMKTMSAVIRGQSDIMQRLENIVGRHEQHLLEGKR